MSTAPHAPSDHAATFKPLASLDFLRSCAVMMVFVGHVSEAFIGKLPLPKMLDLSMLGRLGVACFFVHTSLVLMQSLERSRAQRGTRRLVGSFFIRRLFRIYPLTWAVIALVTLLHIPTESDPAFKDGHHFVMTELSTVDLLSNLALTQNITASPSRPDVLWSLPLEMQMYLLLPLLFFLLQRLSTTQTAFGWSATMLLCVVLGPKVQKVAAGLGFEKLASWWMWLPCFLAGVLAFAWLRQPKQTSRALPFSWGACWIGVLALVHLTHYAREPVMVSCLSLGLLIPIWAEPQSRYLRATGAWIAKYSYGIYLTHRIGMSIGFGYLADLPLLVQLLICIAITLALSVALYHALEAPAIRLGKYLAQRYQSSAA